MMLRRMARTAANNACTVPGDREEVIVTDEPDPAMDVLVARSAAALTAALCTVGAAVLDPADCDRLARASFDTRDGRLRRAVPGQRGWSPTPCDEAPENGRMGAT
jgi:hypothetical protein